MLWRNIQQRRERSSTEEEFTNLNSAVTESLIQRATEAESLTEMRERAISGG